MDVTPFEMLNALCISALCGLSVSFMFDVVDIIVFEFLSKKSKVVTNILDIVSILIFTVIFILLIYYYYDGKVRWVLLSAMLFGSLVYYRVVKNPINKIVKLLVLPIKILLGFLVDKIKKIIKILLQTIAKKRIKLYNKGVK